MKTLPKLQTEMTQTIERDGKKIKQEFFLVETCLDSVKEQLETKLAEVNSDIQA